MSEKKKTTQIINGVCIYFLSREYSGANQNYIILVSTITLILISGKILIDT